RVDAPLVARAVMRDLADPVHDRIAQLEALALHVDLGAEDVLPFLELARAHAAEEVEVLLDAPIAIGARDARLVEIAAVLADLLEALAVDVGLPLADELLGPLVELLEVVGRELHLAVPLEAEPAHV